MGSNRFGNIFQITTWGESHGESMGVIVDGCPSGINLTEEIIEKDLVRRRPGFSAYVSQRNESDTPKILSGVFNGKTTGAPIHIMIENRDARSCEYEKIKDIYRPSHGQYTYHRKYGHYDYRGSGRFSGRETALWVAAGAVAKVLLAEMDLNISISSYLQKVGNFEVTMEKENPQALKKKISKDSIFCPDTKVSEQIKGLLLDLVEKKDSIGGTVGFVISAPVGIGEPIFEKLEANLAKAMLSIPASRGFEIGEGFAFADMLGSQANDSFSCDDNQIQMSSNHSGGVLAGISCGKPIYGRVAFKPTPSIKKEQKTVDVDGNEKIFSIDKNGRHDPCVAIRAVPVVEAMAALVVADLALMNATGFSLTDKNRK